MLPAMFRVNRQAVTHSKILYRVMLITSQPLRVVRRQNVEQQIISSYQTEFVSDTAQGRLSSVRTADLSEMGVFSIPLAIF